MLLINATLIAMGSVIFAMLSAPPPPQAPRLSRPRTHRTRSPLRARSLLGSSQMGVIYIGVTMPHASTSHDDPTRAVARATLQTRRTLTCLSTFYL
eukprot:1636703-Rhodomonas_salina.2